MEFLVYKLFRYSYTYYVQGTAEFADEYALLLVPKDATFENNKSLLFADRYEDVYHEVDIDTIKDLTITF